MSGVVVAFARPMTSTVSTSGADALPVDVHELDWDTLSRRFADVASDDEYNAVSAMMRSILANEVQATVRFYGYAWNTTRGWVKVDKGRKVTVPRFDKWTRATVDAVLARAVSALPRGAGPTVVTFGKCDPEVACIQNNDHVITFGIFDEYDAQKKKLPPAVRRYFYEKTGGRDRAGAERQA